MALLLFQGESGRSAEFELDLEQLEVNGSPAFRGGGGMSPSDRSIFPVEIRLTEIWPPTAAASDELSVRFSIHNVGEVPVMIPASRNYEQVLESGVTNRRTALFGLRVTPVAGFIDAPKATSSFGDMAVGTTDVSGTLVELKPGDVLHVRLRTRLFEHSEQIIQSWIKAAATNVVTLRFQANFTPSDVPDDELVTVARHGSFTSANSVELTIDLGR